MMFTDWWIIGVALAILADVFTNTGTNMQKLAHTHIEMDFRKTKTARAKQALNTPLVMDFATDDTAPLRPSSETDRSPSPHAPDVLRTASFTGTPPAKNQTKPSYWSSPIWITGVGLLVLGAIGDFVALGFAAQSIVAPLGSLTLVVNMFIARWMHGEKVTPLGIVATICIVAGSFIAIAFADHSDFTYT